MSDLDTIFNDYAVRKQTEVQNAATKDAQFAEHRSQASAMLATVVTPTLQTLADEVTSRGYKAEVVAEPVGAAEVVADSAGTDVDTVRFFFGFDPNLPKARCPQLTFAREKNGDIATVYTIKGETRTIVEIPDRIIDLTPANVREQAVSFIKHVLDVM